MSYRKERRSRAGRRTVTAYCCHCPSEWEGPNVQGIAVRHTDATGHRTHVLITQALIYYVPRIELDRQAGDGSS